MRALVLYTASWQDRITSAELEGRTDETADRVNDLLLPIVKGYGSEKSYEQLAQSLQTFGGSGFLQEYPIEQYIRDAKIDTLYEGTTAIQGQDFFFRKIVRDQGKALTVVAGEIQEFIAAQAEGELAAEVKLLATAAEDVQGMVAAMINQLMASEQEIDSIYKVGQNTTRLLIAAGDLVVSWLLLRQASVALAKLAEPTQPTGKPSRDESFYQGKVAAAKHFAREILPLLTAQRVMTEQTDNELMTLPEAAF
jgi:acetyl-CoA dehydrogenase-like protein/acyl-CoA dehydrogenase-like protein